MGVSERHAWRLLAAYRREGAASVAHGNRGRKPSTATSPEMQEKVLALARGPYAGFNHTHLTEMLAEREGVRLSRSTVRRVLLAGGVGSPRRRRSSKRYRRRERYPQEGMLLQIDGSRHDWLEGRGPYLTLIGAVDDATGTVPFALFREQEDAHGYLIMLKEIIDRHGVPLALYSDRHGIFQRAPKDPESLEEQRRGRRDPTQFARALEELGIELILAHTPQAKGRVERAWETFQDRLVSELRLAGVTRHRGGQRPALGLPAALRSALRRGAGPAGTSLSPAGTGPLPRCGLVLQVSSHRGQRRHRPVQRRRSPAPAGRPPGRLRSRHGGSPGAAGRPHRRRPPGQDRGRRPGPRPARRAANSQGPPLQRPPASQQAGPRIPWPSLPTDQHQGPHPNQAIAQPPLEEPPTDIVIEHLP